MKLRAWLVGNSLISKSTYSMIRRFAMEALEGRLVLSVTAPQDVATVAPVESLYVDGTHGSDPGSGAASGLGTTPTNAFKTIQEAANAIGAIDAAAVANNAAAPAIVVYIEQGIYREMVSVNNCTNVRFLPYEHEPVSVSGLDPVQFNSSPDPGTDVWTAGPFYATDYSATTDQLVLGPSATTATDQVFENGQMIPESRYPENPQPNLNETNTQTYGTSKQGVTLLQTPGPTAIPTPSTSAQTAISDSAFFSASFDDPNLLNIVGPTGQRKALSSAQLLNKLQSFLDGATIHTRAISWGWETGTVIGVALDTPTAILNSGGQPITISSVRLKRNIATLTIAGQSQAGSYAVGDTVTISGINPTFNGTHVITAATATSFSYADAAKNVPPTLVSATPRLTYTLPASTSETVAPPPGCFYYLSNFADSNPSALTAAEALALGGAPSTVLSASGSKLKAAAAGGYIIDSDPSSTTYVTPSNAAVGLPLYLHVLSNVQPTGIEIKTRDVAFDLSNSQNITIKGMTLMAATIATDASSTNDVIVNVTAEYLSSYDRTSINASTRRIAPLPNYAQLLNADVAAGMSTADAATGAASTAASMAQSLYASETSAVDIWIQFVSGIELMGQGDELIDSTIEFCAGNGVTIGAVGATVSGCTIHDVDTMGTDNAGIITLAPGYSIASAVISQGSSAAALPADYTTASVTITTLNPNNDFAVGDWIYIEGLAYVSPEIYLQNNFAGCGTFQITSIDSPNSFTYQFTSSINNLSETLDGSASRASNAVANGYAGHVIGKSPGGISTDPIQILGNTIYNFARSGIVDRGVANLKIEYNDIFDGGLVSVDCGGIYSWGQDTSQNTDGVDASGNGVAGNANSEITIEYNTIYDVDCMYGTGVYLDTNNSGNTVEHNIIYNVTIGITFSPPSIDPVIAYNTIAPSVSRVLSALASQNVEEAGGFNIGQGNHVGATVQFNLFGAVIGPDGSAPDANEFSDIPDLTNDATNYFPKGYKLSRVTTNPAKQNYNLKRGVGPSQEDLSLTKAPGLYASYYPGSSLSGDGAIPYGAPWMPSGVNLTASAGTGNTVTLNWTPALPSATSKKNPFAYQIYRYPLNASSNSYDLSDLVATIAGRIHSCTDTLPPVNPLDPPPTYAYFIRAVNKSATAAASTNNADLMLYSSLSNEASVGGE